MDSLILPFQLENAPVRGRLVRLGDTLDQIMSSHNYPAGMAGLCAETAMLAAVVSSLLKYDGIFTLQAQGDGPVSMFVADMTSLGALRACANVRENAILPTHSCAIGDFLGKGYVTFTVDQGQGTERYQGIVELRLEGLKESLLHYFTQSEQIPTGIVMAVRHTAEGWRGGAIVLQEMPRTGGHSVNKSNAEEDDWRRVMTLLLSCTDDELLDDTLSPQDLLFRLFHEETVRAFESLAVYHECRCNRDRLLGVLKTMPQDDIEYLQEDGDITMRCEFCNKVYSFTPKEIRDDTIVH